MKHTTLQRYPKFKNSKNKMGQFFQKYHMDKGKMSQWD